MRNEIQGEEIIQRLLARSPARLMTGSAGPCYRTQTQLQLRVDHAAAIDAVSRELDLARDLGGLVRGVGLFGVASRAASREEFLLRPDLGRQLHPDAEALLREKCVAQPDLQILVGDGLSATAVVAQVPELLPLLMEKAAQAGWKLGTPFFVRNCRVGILNAVGEILRPEVAVLLIGERPGLATAESLSAYFAYRPQRGQTDADRNLISNIHKQGVAVAEASDRILALAGRMRAQQTGGVQVKELLLESADRPGPGPLGFQAPAGGM